ncbi:hypothetical protein F220043C3_17540 [Enterocloster asparagiformis]|uniref:hypothetical protein n=1 Tax=Enterocloster asparagiformis TaxID=333367 RepID=UPI0034BE64DD
MKKAFVTIGMAAVLSMASCMTAFAGWEQMGTAWKYQNTEGAYYNDGWHWIDGNGDNIAECYFFNTDNTMLSNTTTPDNFRVNENGAWTVNGVVQTKAQVAETKATPEQETKSAPVETQAPTPQQTEPAPTQADSLTGDPALDAAIAEAERQQAEKGRRVTAPGGDSYDYNEPLKGITWN